MGGRTFLTARPHLEAETALPRRINRVATTDNVRVLGQCPSAARSCALASSPHVLLRPGGKGDRYRSEIKRHKQGARDILVRLAAALPSTRPRPLASLLHPIVYVTLIE